MTAKAALLAAAVLLGLAWELMMRAVARVGGTPVWWHDSFTQAKEAQLHELRHAGGVDVVFIGTSMMLLGLDPDRVGARTGLRCYNASVYRGVPTVSEAFLTDVVLREVRPSLVVMGMSPFDVNDNGLLATRLAEYRAAKVFTGGPIWSFVRFFGRHCYTIRNLPALKHPPELGRNLVTAWRTGAPGRWRVIHEIPGYLGPAGQGLEFLQRHYFTGPQMYALIRRQAYDNYDNGGVQMEAFRRVVALNARHGARTVFAAMPVAAAFFEGMFIGGRERWEREWTTLRRLAGELGVPVVDVASEFEGEQYYADLIHMNRAGRDSFTDRLCEALLAEGLLAEGASRR